MTQLTPRIAPLALVIVAPACTSPAHWSNDDALAAESIEVGLTREGWPLEIEYHLSPDEVPEAVHAAMDRLHPGGQATDAEKEYEGGDLYWELTKDIDGRAVEAMFTPDGALHSEEVEVAADSVPQQVRDAAAARLGGDIAKWEEIRDANRELVEYHAKVDAGGKRYKVKIDADGTVTGLVREVEAEIEVQVD